MTTASARQRHAGGLATAAPYLLFILCALLWAANTVFARGAREVLPPVTLGFGRWAIAVICLAPFALPHLKGKWPIIRRHLGLIFLLGLLAGALFHATIYTGLRYTVAINASLMNSSSPVFIIVLSWLLDGEKVAPRQLAGMLLSFLGIGIIVTQGEFSRLLDLQFNAGDLIILTANIAWGLYCVLVRRVPRGLDTLSLLFVSAVAGLIISAPFYAAEGLFFPPPIWNAMSIGVILYTGIPATVIAYFLWNKGVELLGANKASLTTPLQAAFGTLLAIVLLGEQFHPFQAAGIVVIVFGVWLASSARRRQPAALPID